MLAWKLTLTSFLTLKTAINHQHNTVNVLSCRSNIKSWLAKTFLQLNESNLKFFYLALTSTKAHLKYKLGGLSFNMKPGIQGGTNMLPSAEENSEDHH